MRYHAAISGVPTLAFVCFLLGAMVTGAPRAETQGDSDGYREVARFDYGEASVSGLGSAKWTTGATLATMPPDNQGLSRFVFSLAFDRGGRDAGSIRLTAHDASGNVLPNDSECAASGAGTDYRVVTFVCAFKHGHDKIKELVIEEKTSP